MLQVKQPRYEQPHSSRPGKSSKVAQFNFWKQNWQNFGD